MEPPSPRHEHGEGAHHVPAELVECSLQGRTERVAGRNDCSGAPENGAGSPAVVRVA